MTKYQQWIESERKWIGEYCSKTKKSAILKVAPITTVGFTVLMGALAFAETEFSTSILIENAAGGFIIGAFFSIIYILIMCMSLSSKKYAKKVNRAVNQLGLTDDAKELMAEEFLEAQKDESKKIDFVISGPNAKGTPAKFMVTRNYAILMGSNPYAILVRLSDIAHIEAGEETKTALRHGSQMNTYYKYTLYTLGFFRKDRNERGLAERELPDEAMGFMVEDIRDKARKMLAQNWQM